MHRDIKPDNFILVGQNLLNEPEVSLIDFGFMTSKFYDNVYLGTSTYMSQEFDKQLKKADYYDQTVDVYALGKILIMDLQNIMKKEQITLALFYIIQQTIQPNPCYFYKKNIICKRESEFLSNVQGDIPQLLNSVIQYDQYLNN